MSGGGNAGGLVPYSDSDASGEGEESAEAGKQPLRKRCRVAASTKNQEGRRFPAVAGNWQTHIRIQLPESEELDDACSTLVRQLATVKSPSLNPTWSSARHISLSRTVVLRMHQIDGFIARLKHHVRNTAPFQVEFDGLQQYCNEDRSKGFLGWVCRRGRTDVCSLIDRVDAALAEFGLPPFYAERDVHASLVSWPESNPTQTSLPRSGGGGCGKLSVRKGNSTATTCADRSSNSRARHGHIQGDGRSTNTVEGEQVLSASAAVEEQVSVLASIAHSAGIPTIQASAFESSAVAFAKACVAEGVEESVVISSIRCRIGSQQYEIQLGGRIGT